MSVQSGRKSGRVSIIGSGIGQQEIRRAGDLYVTDLLTSDLLRSGVNRRSEGHLHAQLNLPRGERRVDRAERARGTVAVRRTEVRRVEQVERLDACFEPGLIASEPEALVQAQIELVERGAAHGVARR